MSDTVLETIRAALAPDATPESRAAGASGCRGILNAFEPPSSQPAAAPLDASQITNVIATLRGVPAEQLLDLAIARLRAALPSGAQVPSVQPIKFQMIAVEQLIPKRAP